MDEATQQQRADKAREWITAERARKAADLLDVMDPQRHPEFGHLIKAAKLYRTDIEALDTVSKMLHEHYPPGFNAIIS